MSMRVFRDVFESFLSMGPLSSVLGMIPGFDASFLRQGNDKASQVCQPTSAGACRVDTEERGEAEGGQHHPCVCVCLCVCVCV